MNAINLARVLGVILAISCVLGAVGQGGGGGEGPVICYHYGNSANTGCLDDAGTCVWYAPNFGYTAVGTWLCCYQDGYLVGDPASYNCDWVPNYGCCNNLANPVCPSFICPPTEPPGS